MNLISVGDSFVYGTELADQRPGRYSRLTYPALFAKSQSWNYTSIAYPGISNGSIARRTIDYCVSHPDTPKFMFVGWTFSNRYEFHFMASQEPWQNITPWLLETRERIVRELKHHSEEVVEEQLRNNQKQASIGVYDFAKSLYKHVAISEYWETYSTLKEMLFLQNFFQVHKIPYIYTVADSTCLTGHAAGSPDASMGSLLKSLDHSRIYLFPGNKGFYQWAMENKYPVGVTHPLEAAHMDAASLLKEYFNEMDQELNQSNQVGNTLS